MRWSTHSGQSCARPCAVASCKAHGMLNAQQHALFSILLTLSAGVASVRLPAGQHVAQKLPTDCPRTLSYQPRPLRPPLLLATTRHHNITARPLLPSSSSLSFMPGTQRQRTHPRPRMSFAGRQSGGVPCPQSQRVRTCTCCCIALQRRYNHRRHHMQPPRHAPTVVNSQTTSSNKKATTKHVHATTARTHQPDPQQHQMPCTRRQHWQGYGGACRQ